VGGVCQGAVDLALIVDESGSVGHSNWALLQEGLAGMVEAQFEFAGEAGTKVALGTFDTAATSVYDGMSADQAFIADQLRTMPFNGGGDRAAKGLKWAQQALEAHGRADLGVPKVIAIVIDGLNTNGLEDASNDIKTNGVVIGGEKHEVRVIPVAIHPNAQTSWSSELEQMATDPADVIYDTSFNNFDVIAEKIAEKACSAAPAPSGI